MKASRLILSMFALAALSVANVASAHEVANTGYLIDSQGKVVKNNFGECWKTGYWTPAMATAECDSSLVKKEETKKDEPMAAAAPAEAGPSKPAFAAITLQAETLFDFDKAVLRADGKKTLDTEVVEKMKANPQVEVVLVTGHADRIGSDSYNQKLSQRRADAAKAYLVSQGIDSKRIETASKGESEPVVACNDIKGKVSGKNKKLVECLQPNRRVVVEVKVQAQK
ncbi:OmpA family protein [Sulfurirhabdus autotrophica]|uniref:OOP family OmpA-OmpF porin n=1 Tax=Sulfurirhabdus autotrophica TaxID=1706046 RepID=A0A4R3YDG4_9PROT|nr:OmpA family protein [Sulfurirhabdus autotrophica]TCV90535.1 OOP family OmpA-OmpF porin [Sulfurirhabdus autotrophica]